jgi:hypothetical protein
MNSVAYDAIKSTNKTSGFCPPTHTQKQNSKTSVRVLIVHTGIYMIGQWTGLICCSCPLILCQRNSLSNSGWMLNVQQLYMKVDWCVCVKVFFMLCDCTWVNLGMCVNLPCCAWGPGSLETLNLAGATHHCSWTRYAQMRSFTWGERKIPSIKCIGQI